MRQRQFSAAFRSLACQSRTSVPTRASRSTLSATQVVRKRKLLALGAIHVGGSPQTSGQGRSSKPDATFHPARWAAQAAKRISRDPPRLPRNLQLPTRSGHSTVDPIIDIALAVLGEVCSVPRALHSKLASEPLGLLTASDQSVGAARIDESVITDYCPEHLN